MKAKAMIEILQSVVDSHGDVSLQVEDEGERKRVTGVWVKHPVPDGQPTVVFVARSLVFHDE